MIKNLFLLCLFCTALSCAHRSQRPPLCEASIDKDGCQCQCACGEVTDAGPYSK